MFAKKQLTWMMLISIITIVFSGRRDIKII